MCNMWPERVEDASEWGVDVVDVPGYLRLLGLSAADLSIPDLATLSWLQRLHQQAIPFANTDILLGYGVDLELAAIQHKLVNNRRGGYCHEHNLLFAAILSRLGYRVTRLSGRVRVGHSPRLRPRTHMTLLVAVQETHYLVDVGFGGTGPLGPIPLHTDAVQTHSEWTYRLRRGSPDGWLLQLHTGTGWSDLYSFGIEPVHPIDYQVATYYTSTHPHSPFVHGLRVAITQPQTRLLLDGRQFTELHPGQSMPRAVLDDHGFAAALGETFELHLPESDLAALASYTRPPEQEHHNVDQ